MRIFPLAMLLTLALFCALPLVRGSDPEALPSMIVGKPAPPLHLPLALDERQTIDASALRGRESLVVFFASWCASCRGEMAVLHDIAQRHRVPIYGIACKDNPDILRDWLKGTGNPFTALAADGDGRTMIDWGVTGVPETFLVDAQGTVRLRYAGALSWEVWKRDFLPLSGLDHFNAKTTQ